MKNYIVDLGSFNVEAEDENEAIEKAREFFDNDSTDRSLFGVNVEEES